MYCDNSLILNLRLINIMSILSDRILSVKPSLTIAITTKARMLKESGKEVISLGAGEPDFDTPNNIKEAAKKAIMDGKTKYTPVDGIKELKKAICDKFLRENNISYDISEITVGCGAKQVIYNAFMATLNPGDEVIIPSPYWVSYPDIVRLAGGTPVIVESRIENNFKLKAADIEKAITAKTKWVMMNSPSNPSGAVYSYEEIKSIAEVMLKYDKIQVLSDDIYEHILYSDEKHKTLAEVEPLLKDRVFTVNGVSKSYSMTGWRIGYAGGNKELIKAISVLQSQSTSNPCSISQYAALEALTGNQSFLKSNAEIFKKRRDKGVEMLNSIDGISCTSPDGAFYLFVSCKGIIGRKTPDGKIIQKDTDFAEYLLENALVAVVPGSAFGMEGFFRISFATSDDLLEKAYKKISNACEKLIVNN